MIYNSSLVMGQGFGTAGQLPAQSIGCRFGTRASSSNARRHPTFGTNTLSHAGDSGHFGWTLDHAVFTVDTVTPAVQNPITDTSTDTVQFVVLYRDTSGSEELGSVDLTGEVSLPSCSNLVDLFSVE